MANPDDNDQPDLYLFDRVTRQTSLVSVGLTGASGLGESNAPSLSGTGRYVAFWSRATNLVAADVNVWYNVYLRDNVTQRTSRVSNGNFWSVDPAITPDGVYVAFESYADNLVAGDTNQMSDVYVGLPLPAAYTLYDAQRALRIAGGMIIADAIDLSRSNVEAGSRIDILDASRIVRKAMGLDT